MMKIFCQEIQRVRYYGNETKTNRKKDRYTI